MPDLPQIATFDDALLTAPRKQAGNESSFSVSVGQVYDGPLDLLLDLIRKQDIDIYDIPIAKITAQYLGYVENMKQLDVDVAAEFIYMASVLIHIKSKMLLPRDPLTRPERKTIRAANWSTACWSTRRFKPPRRCCCRSSRLKTPSGRIPRSRNFKTPKAPSRNWRPTWSTWSEHFSRFWTGRAPSAFDVTEDTVTVWPDDRVCPPATVAGGKTDPAEAAAAQSASRQALVCAFLAMLELIRLQAVLARQDNVFGDIVLKKHTAFDNLVAEDSAIKDDWR